jgi:hypothetical protein
VPIHLPLVCLPRKDLFFLAALHFLKIMYILVVQGDFALVLQACIYHALIKLTPPLYLLIFYHQALLIFNNLQYSALYYIHIYMGYFNIFHSLVFFYLLLPPVVPSDRLTNTILLSLSQYMYIYTYTHIYDHISFYLYI